MTYSRLLPDGTMETSEEPPEGWIGVGEDAGFALSEGICPDCHVDLEPAARHDVTVAGRCPRCGWLWTLKPGCITAQRTGPRADGQWGVTLQVRSRFYMPEWSQ